jgi:hypothetical protein
MGRYDNLRRIQQLDPQRNATEIYTLTGCYEFPWDQIRSLEIALYRTYCVPSISALLDKTGEFEQRTQKRYDDTSLIVAEMSAFGYDSERGRAAQRRMNRIHKQYDISNDDYLYVLSTFIYEPIRWNARFGWRNMCEKERLAAYYFWRAIGQRMNIKNIPESYEAFEQFNRDYERDHFRYAESNKRIGEATRDLFLSWFGLPTSISKLFRPVVYALLDNSMLDAFGFPHPPQFLRSLLSVTLKTRAFALRFFPPRKHPYIYVEEAPHRAYPNGYNLTDLGPPHMLAMLNKTLNQGRANEVDVVVD